MSDAKDYRAPKGGGKKGRISATASQWLIDEMDIWVDSGKFSSASEFVSTAIAFFLAKLDTEQEIELLQEEITILQHRLDEVLKQRRENTTKKQSR